MPTPITDAELADLRRIAEAMPSGPYQIKNDPAETRLKAVAYSYEYDPGEFVSVWLARELTPKDANFFAGWNRETCLRLLAELARLRAANAEMAAALEPFAAIWNCDRDESMLMPWADCKVAAETLARHEAAKGQK